MASIATTPGLPRTVGFNCEEDDTDDDGEGKDEKK